MELDRQQNSGGAVSSGSDRTKSTAGSSASRARELATLIQKDISTGRLSAGSWLKQVDLEAQYGASRLDIRQALDRLEEKGFVKLEANRGYKVETFDAQRYRNIVSIRATLEIAAGEDVMGRIDEAGLAALQHHADLFAKAVAGGTIAEQEEANFAFHSAMLAFCSNRDLVSLIFDLRGRVPVSFTRERNTATRLAGTAQDHYDIVACLRRHDRDGLAAILRQHVLGGIDNI